MNFIAATCLVRSGCFPSTSWWLMPQLENWPKILGIGAVLNFRPSWRWALLISHGPIRIIAACLVRNALLMSVMTGGATLWTWTRSARNWKAALPLASWKAAFFRSAVNIVPPCCARNPIQYRTGHAVELGIATPHWFGPFVSFLAAATNSS